MSSKFMVKKEPIEVEISYLDANGEIVIVKGEENKKTYANALKTLRAKFFRPNNKLFNLCLNGCIRQNEFGDTFLDRNLYNDKRFRILFIEAIDGDGEKITNSPSDVDGLMSDVTSSLLEALDFAIESEKLEALKKKGYVDSEGNIKTNKKNTDNDIEYKPGDDVKIQIVK